MSSEDDSPQGMADEEGGSHLAESAGPGDFSPAHGTMLSGGEARESRSRQALGQPVFQLSRDEKVIRDGEDLRSKYDAGAVSD